MNSNPRWVEKRPRVTDITGHITKLLVSQVSSAWWKRAFSKYPLNTTKYTNNLKHKAEKCRAQPHNRQGWGSWTPFYSQLGSPKESRESWPWNTNWRTDGIPWTKTTGEWKEEKHSWRTNWECSVRSILETKARHQVWGVEKRSEYLEYSIWC